MAKNRKPIPKTQKQISNSFVEPYDTTRGNPNNAIPDPKNRALQTSWKGDNVKPYTVGIQDIDEAIFYYMEEVIKPFVIQNGEKISVPVIYGSPEKWKSYQKDGYYRDVKGTIMAPLIMFKRENIEKNRSLTNKIDANNPNNYGIFQKSYNTRNAYDNFSALNNRIPQKQYYAVVVPDYMTVSYNFVVFTYYVEQLNKIVEAIQYASDSYWGNPERFKFKAMIDSFGFQTELSENSERVVRSTFTLKINGYLIPDTLQKNVTAVNKFSNKTKVLLSEFVDGVEDVSYPVLISEEPEVLGLLLLDTYSGAAAAYSLRKLSTSYSGAAIRVRRSSDDTEQDIGFDSNGDLDTTTLLAFVGTGGTDNGFVKTWYDQSGNGNDATQTTATDQPQIVSSGSVILDNGKPSLTFDGVNDTLLSSGLNAGLNDITTFNVANVISESSGKFMIWANGGSSTGSAGLSLWGEVNNRLRSRYWDGLGGSITHSPLFITNNKQILFYVYADRDNLSLQEFKNDTSNNSNTVDISTYSSINLNNTNDFSIGFGVEYGDRYLNGKIQEIIIYHSDQSSNKTGIETNINNHYNIYP